MIYRKIAYWYPRVPPGHPVILLWCPRIPPTLQGLKFMIGVRLSGQKPAPMYQASEQTAIPVPKARDMRCNYPAESKDTEIFEFSTKALNGNRMPGK